MSSDSLRTETLSSVTWREILGVLAGLAVVLTLLEWKYRYYFLQDDNRDFVLPWLVHAWRGLMQGELAFYNFHQYSGYPSLGSAQSGTLYPPGYLAVFLSQAIFGHAFASVDILTILHLALGVVGWLFFFRRIGLGQLAAVWGALACDLNSFVIYGGSSWLCISVLAAYFPWMLYFGLEFLRGPTWWKWAGLLAARLLLFYYGYVQYFFYGSVLEMLVLAGVWISWPDTVARVRRRFILISYAAGWVYVTLLAMPLLLPLWQQTEASAFRSGALSLAQFADLSINVNAWLFGLLRPFSLQMPRNIGQAIPYLGHVGYLTLVAALVALYLGVRAKPNAERQRLTLVFLILAVGTLVLSMGGLASWLYHVPVYNRFRWPFKLLAFSNYFQVALAALALDYVMQTVSGWPRRLLGSLCIMICLFNGLVLYAGFAPKPFRTHLDPVPLQEPLRDTLRDGKILTVGFDVWYPKAVDAVAFNYATLWNLYQFGGYEPLVPLTNFELSMGLLYFSSFDADPALLPFDLLRQWGVRWYVVNNPPGRYEVTLLGHGLAAAYRDRGRVVYRDPLAKPLAFWMDGRSDPVDYEIRTNSIHLHAAPREAGRACLSFLWHPRFDLLVDGAPGVLRSNRFGQMCVDIPAGEHSLVIRYSDPDFLMGLWLAALGLAAVAGNILLGRRA